MECRTHTFIDMRPERFPGVNSLTMCHTFTYNCDVAVRILRRDFSAYLVILQQNLNILHQGKKKTFRKKTTKEKII